MIIEVIAVLLAIAAIIWLIIAVFLTAPDYSQFDQPQHEPYRNPSEVSAENKEVRRLIGAMQDQLRAESKYKRISKLRCIMDEGFTGSPAQAEHLGVDIMATDASGVDAEWVVAPGATHSSVTSTS